jgi:hypothetical protein
MTAIYALLAVWGSLTTVLVLLLIYRGTLSIHEDDQLFLDSSQNLLRQEQSEVLRKVSRVNPLVHLFGAVSGGLILVIFCLWIYQGLFVA